MYPLSHPEALEPSIPPPPSPLSFLYIQGPFKSLLFLCCRKPSDSNHRSNWLPKRLLKKNRLFWLAQKQPGMPDSLLPLRELPRPRLDPLQLGYGPLPWPALMPALHRKRRAAQLMRVGCALGTCQVQNLSHRLWQLKGQLGRQDSSPISLHSPHSYG